jgi:hypothetical protein
MIEAHKEMCRKDREVVKKGESFLARTEREVIEPLAWVEKAEELERRLRGLEAQVTNSSETLVEVERIVEMIDRISGFLSQMPEIVTPGVPELCDDDAAERLLAELVSLEAVSGLTNVEAVVSRSIPWANTDDADRLAREWASAVLPASIEPLETVKVPDVHDTTTGDRLAQDMAVISLVARATAPNVPEAPTIVDEEGIIEMGRAWATAHRLASQIEPTLPPRAPELLDEAHVADLCGSMIVERQGIGQSEKELAALLREMERVERDKNLILEQTGGACPVCNSLLKEHRQCA